MRYFGGKSRIAKHIAPFIQESVDSTGRFASLFLGGGSVEQYIKCEHKILSDFHPYLIAMYKKLQNEGTGFLPNNVNEEEYNRLKEKSLKGFVLNDEENALIGFVGFACSFAGKWFGGYARDNKHSRNFADVAKRGLQKKLNNGLLDNAKIGCYSYLSFDYLNGYTIYLDPPYAKTTGYSLGKFDSALFWEVSKQLSLNNDVFVSECICPVEHDVLWKKEVKRDMRNTKNKREINATEKLIKLI